MAGPDRKREREAERLWEVRVRAALRAGAMPPVRPRGVVLRGRRREVGSEE